MKTKQIKVKSKKLNRKRKSPEERLQMGRPCVMLTKKDKQNSRKGRKPRTERY